MMSGKSGFLDILTLREKAEAATPGPWENRTGMWNHIDGAIGAGNKHIALCGSLNTPEEERRVTRNQMLANADYIAAANPTAILQLLDIVEDILDSVYMEYTEKGVNACPVCSTYTHKSWCWYPDLLQIMGKPLDEFARRHIEQKARLRGGNNGRT